MLQIKVDSTDTFENQIQGGTNKAGKAYDTFTKVSQAAYVMGLLDDHGNPERYPIKINIDLGTTKQRDVALAIGTYQVTPQSFFVDRFGGLKLGKLYLQAIAKPAQKAA